MAERLSTLEHQKTLDGGQSSLGWTPPPPSGFLAGVDLKAIMERPEAKEIIQAMPPQPLFYSLKHRGLVESIDVLPHLTVDQFTRMLDYDIWAKDEVSFGRFVAWIEAYGQVGGKELAERFIDLEEEYQLALLIGKFEVFTEEDVGSMSKMEEDSLSVMPCGTVFYRVTGKDKEEQLALELLFNTLISENLKYAYALIGHSAYMPPNESEGLLRQFREARLEEDGFVSYEESLEVFQTHTASATIAKWEAFREKNDVSGLVQQTDDDRPYLDRVFDFARAHDVSIDEQFAMHQGLLYLCNALSASAGVEISDAHGVARVLELGRSMVSLGLETLSHGREKLALHILQAESMKEIFRVGLSLVEGLRQSFLESDVVQFPQLSSLRELYLQKKYGAIVDILDTEWLAFIGSEGVEIIKGLFNRFPMVLEDVIQEANLGGRRQFLPIHNLARFKKLCARVSAITAMIDFLRSAGCEWEKSSEESFSLDQGVMTISARRLLGEQALLLPFSQKEMDALMGLKNEDLEGLLGAYLKEVEVFVSSRIHSWALFSGVEIKSEAVSYMLHMMSDILMGFVTAWHHGRESVSGMILVEKEVLR